ncbi:MAG: membrane protein insertase YidC, partial [Ignavibacteria bacterium]
MDRQTTVAFVLIGLILVVWLYINAPEAPQQNPNSADSTLVQEKPVEQEKPQAKKVETPIQKDKPIVNRIQADSLPVRIITVETDLAKFELTTRGARIRKYYLKEFETWYVNKITDTTNFYDRHVQLINPQNGGDLNLAFLTKDGKLVNTADLDFYTSKDNYYYKITGDDSLRFDFTLKIDGNREIRKNFTFYANDYASNLDIEMVNMNDLISGFRYDLIWQNGINFVEENSNDEARYAHAAAYSGDEIVKVDAGTEEKIEKEINGRVDFVSVKGKYFAMILAPVKPYDEGGAYFEGEHIKLNELDEREYYSAALKIPYLEKDYQKDSFILYLGPVDYDILKSYDKHFETIFDWGSFLGLTIIIQPISEYILLPLLKFLHTFIPNYGWVLIVISILIKFVLYPLTRQSYQSMRKMQLLQPKIKEIKEKYKDDPQRQQKETMKLYQTYGINPAGGCLPMLLQMPILIALWSLFNVAIELRHEPFIWWITNLSSPDVIYNLGFRLPLFGVDKISGLAILL